MKRETNLNIREMIVDDIPAVFHLGEELFTPQKYPNLYRTWDEYEVMNLFMADREFCLVASLRKKLVGFALATYVEKSRTAWNYGHLVWLGVDPAYQRQGIANKLVVLLRDKMVQKGVRILLVDTQSDNKKAIKFFKKHKFSNPTNHVYMTLNLDDYSSNNK
jgi:ribosomal protein S18 acetylase RimI-like enzyme